jgi:uncharacterized protein
MANFRIGTLAALPRTPSLSPCKARTIGEGSHAVNHRADNLREKISLTKTMIYMQTFDLRWEPGGAIVGPATGDGGMREKIAEALKTAIKAGDKRSMTTLRMVNAAIQDRDIANRGAGKGPASDEDVMLILAKMVKQREESAKAFEEGNRPELAGQERDEIGIIRDFLPKQLDDEAVKGAVQLVIREIDAEGLRDMDRVMSALKEKYAGQMDFGRASAIVKSMLQ